MPSQVRYATQTYPTLAYESTISNYTNKGRRPLLHEHTKNWSADFRSNQPRKGLKSEDYFSRGSSIRYAPSGVSVYKPRTLPRAALDAQASTDVLGNALQAASAEGRQDLVKRLLDAGVGVNAKGGFYGNALQAASEQGHLVVVQLLLDAGADVNAQEGHFGSALQAASWGGHWGVVQMLLEAGADANAYGGEYGSAVQAAAEGGHSAIVRTLKREGAQLLQ